MRQCHCPSVRLSVCDGSALAHFYVSNSDPNLPRIVVAGSGHLNNNISRYASHCYALLLNCYHNTRDRVTVSKTAFRDAVIRPSRRKLLSLVSLLFIDFIVWRHVVYATIGTISVRLFSIICL